VAALQEVDVTLGSSHLPGEKEGRAHLSTFNNDTLSNREARALALKGHLGDFLRHFIIFCQCYIVNLFYSKGCLKFKAGGVLEV
jgi:hypothetical protein